MRLFSEVVDVFSYFVSPLTTINQIWSFSTHAVVVLSVAAIWIYLFKTRKGTNR